MKYSSYNLSLLYAIIISIIVLAGCQHDHGTDEGQHVHDDGSVHMPNKESGDQDDHDDHGKSVHLNEAQYLNAQIDTGWFMMKNLSDVVHANGYTKLDPQDEADVNIPISGTITSVKVIEGNHVRKGQVLATMTSLDYNNMLLQRSQLMKERTIAEAGLVYLQQEYDRQKSLSDQNINARKTFQKIKADLNIEKAKINSANQQIQITDQTLNLINSNGSSIINITAPISGYITDVNIKMGSITMPGNPMFGIVDNSQMHVDLLIYEKDLGEIKVGQTVRFILTNQSNMEIKGEIYNIGKSFANDTKSVAVHADIEKNNANLIPGMYINALIDIGSNLVQTLPEDAVVIAEGRTFVFLWEGENGMRTDDHDEITFARLEVKTGAKQLGRIQITPLGEIHDGDRIVTHGAYYLQSHLQKAEGGGGHHH